MSSLRAPNEFLSRATEWPEGVSRRKFLKLMGASIALASATGCTRNPLEHIVPYQKQPEEIIPGRPLFYASALAADFLRGLGLVPETGRRHLALDLIERLACRVEVKDSSGPVANGL